MSWLDLRRAATYLSLAPRTLRKYLSDPVHPLPAHRVGGKWLMSERELDMWVERFPKGLADIDQMVDEVLTDLKEKKRGRG